jgi:hypothetical protein
MFVGWRSCLPVPSLYVLGLLQTLPSGNYVRISIQDQQVGCAPRTTYGLRPQNGMRGIPRLLGHGPCGDGAWNAPYQKTGSHCEFHTNPITQIRV